MANEPTIEMMKYTIAKFMGYEKVTIAYADSEEKSEWQLNNEEWMSKVGIENVGDYIVNVKEDKWFEWNDVAYHREWNWLMPVVEKIENPEVDVENNTVLRAAANVKILYKACVIEYEPDEESGDTNKEIAMQSSGKTKLQAVHSAVYLFIQWYNQQKQKDGE